MANLGIYSKDLAVLITAHNRRDKTIDCLGRLIEQSQIAHWIRMKVFLVDDGSTDGTAELVKDQFPSVEVIQGTGQLYWNRGMRMAWEMAACGNPDFFLWLNDDVSLVPDAVARFFEVYFSLVRNGESERTIVVGTCLDPDSGNPCYGGWDDSGEMVHDEKTSSICSLFNGNCVLIPWGVYNILGNLNPFYRHAYGDFDYSIRAKRAGIPAYVCPGYIGSCSHHGEGAWSDPDLPFSKRWKQFHSITGVHPKDFLYFSIVRHGLRGLLYFFNAYRRMIFGIKK